MIDTNKSMPFTNYSMQANNPDIQLERDHEKCLKDYSRPVNSYCLFQDIELFENYWTNVYHDIWECLHQSIIFFFHNYPKWLFEVDKNHSHWKKYELSLANLCDNSPYCSCLFILFIVRAHPGILYLPRREFIPRSMDSSEGRSIHLCTPFITTLKNRVNGSTKHPHT